MCMFVYMLVGIGHTHNDEEHRSGNVSHVNRVDDEGYGLARFHVSHVVPRMTPPIDALTGTKGVLTLRVDRTKVRSRRLEAGDFDRLFSNELVSDAHFIYWLPSLPPTSSSRRRSCPPTASTR